MQLEGVQFHSNFRLELRHCGFAIANKKKRFFGNKKLDNKNVAQCQ